MWYRATVEANGLYITDPDVFATLGLIGFTVAQPFTQGRQGAGRGRHRHHARRPVAIHRRAQGQPQHAELRPRPARPRARRLRPLEDLHRRQGQGRPAPHQRLENELPALAYGAHPRNGGGTLYSFTYDGHEYFASLSTLPADFGKRWQLFIVTPVADFTGAFDRNNRLLLTVGLVATAAGAHRHLLPVGHAVGAARAAGRQGRP